MPEPCTKLESIADDWTTYAPALKRIAPLERLGAVMLTALRDSKIDIAQNPSEEKVLFNCRRLTESLILWGDETIVSALLATAVGDPTTPCTEDWAVKLRPTVYLRLLRNSAQEDPHELAERLIDQILTDQAGVESTINALITKEEGERRRAYLERYRDDFVAHLGECAAKRFITFYTGH